jgi:hypothetical protein
MPNDPIVEFAQGRFGTDTGLPADAVARARPPDWLPGDVAEAAVLVEADNPITVEGRVPTPHEPPPTGDGTTAEALAYYLPFHFYRTAWGIYIRGAGVWALARRLALPEKLLDVNILACAYNLLLDHERFHFIAEYAASRVEVVTAQVCYETYFKDNAAALHEEALANAHAYRSLRRHASPKVVQATSAWMDTQGPGYCDFSKWLPPRFTDGERHASVSMTKLAAVNNMLTVAQHPADFLFRNTSTRPVLVYIVLDLSVPWVRVAKPFPKAFGLQVFVYSNDHKPHHIHIECPPGIPRTRYRWPDLTPLARGDHPLRANEEKRLRQYVKVHGSAIKSKIEAIPWK